MLTIALSFLLFEFFERSLTNLRERVVIYNVMGQAVRTFDNPGRTIEIQDLPPGNYFLEVHGNERIAHLPLLVE